VLVSFFNFTIVSGEFLIKRRLNRTLIDYMMS
jgi:hypothetical protein